MLLRTKQNHFKYSWLGNLCLLSRLHDQLHMKHPRSDELWWNLCLALTARAASPEPAFGSWLQGRFKTLASASTVIAPYLCSLAPTQGTWDLPFKYLHTHTSHTRLDTVEAELQICIIHLFFPMILLWSRRWDYSHIRPSVSRELPVISIFIPSVLSQKTLQEILILNTDANYNEKSGI